MSGYRRTKVCDSDGVVTGGDLQPIVNIKREKMSFYRKLKLDKDTMKCIKFLNTMQGGL